MVTYFVDRRVTTDRMWANIFGPVSAISDAVRMVANASIGPTAEIRLRGLSTELQPDGTITRRELTPDELAAAIRGEQVPTKPVKAVVVVRDCDGCEAIYVDGKLFRQMSLGEDDDLGVGDCVDAANGSPVTLDVRWADREIVAWPKTLTDLRISD